VTRRKQAGFYLLECLLTLAITGVLLGIGSANFHRWWLTEYAHRVQQQLQSSVQYAALLARLRQQTLWLCGISQRPGCDADWSRGWQLIEPTEHTVLQSYPLAHSFTLIWRGSLHRPVAFAPNGRPGGVQGGWHGSYQGRELFYLVMRRVL
jgi:Tfp pilus assembly protein FimT